MYRFSLFGNIIFTAIVAVIFCCCKTAQPNFQQQYDSFNYHVPTSISEERIFYLLYEINQTKNVRNNLIENETFSTVRQQIISSYENAVKNSKNLNDLSNALFISDSTNNIIKNELGTVYHTSEKLQSLMHDKIRASHFYVLYEPLSDSMLLMNAWNDQVKGINHIFKAYLQHKDLTYPDIDSAKFSAKSNGYFDSVKNLMHQILRKKNNDLFFLPSESLSLALLQMNGRNEAGRMFPLSSINSAAYKKVKSVRWNDYHYSAILVYGAGPGERNVHFSSEGKRRCDSAAALYKKNLAPFVIVSGGFVHPFLTHFCEAVEMRNYLVNRCGIPADAVIMEPHARHTTTNIRDANRILIANKFPLNKPVLGVSSKGHIDYITGNDFIKVFHRDIGFVSFTDMTRIAPCEASYLPALSSTQIDSDEPSDP